ncbi:hypothetical protein ACHQM5_006549 [Ranunculus cassubicifolius]
MAEAFTANPSLSSSTPLLTPSISSLRHSHISMTNLLAFPHPQFLHSRISHSIARIHPTKSHISLAFSRVPVKPRNLGLRVSAQSGEGEEEKVDVDEAARGDSTMPSRFRYLTKEAPDRPVRWPWLIALAFGIYAWRTVLWELSNWRKGLLSIGQLIAYLSKFALGLIIPYIGPPITAVIRLIETILYAIRSIYSSILAAAPVQELTVIIILTSTLLAIAEAAVPDSANSQPYLLTLAGITGFAAVTDFVSEPVFWLIITGIFGFSRFWKKRDLVTSTLPVAAALAAVGQTWLRVVVMGLYVALAIWHYSRKSEEGGSEVGGVGHGKRIPAPLVVAGLTIGIHVAAKWVRYRHLTWMIV